MKSLVFISIIIALAFGPTTSSFYHPKAFFSRFELDLLNEAHDRGCLSVMDIRISDECLLNLLAKRSILQYQPYQYQPYKYQQPWASGYELRI